MERNDNDFNNEDETTWEMVNKSYLERNIYDHFLKGIITLIVMTIMLGFFISLAEDSSYGDLHFSQINVTERPTTTMSTTTGKCSLQVISPFLPK